MSRLRQFLALAALLTYVAFAPAPVSGISNGVVISQIYGGGGNTGATYRNDFIELYNRGSAPVDLTGWSVQYASSAGTTWQKTNLTSTVLQPGQYYLIQEAQGAGGTVNLPPPDAIGTIPMSASAGKVALVSTQALLTGGCPGGSAIVDFVGFGSSATCFEGAGPTATLNNTTAAFRLNNGATDTDSNNADFTIGAPNPRNSSPATPPTISSLSATPLLAYAGEVVTFTVVAAPGTNPVDSNFTVTADFSSIGSATPFVLTGSNAMTGEKTYAATVTISGAPGPRTIAVTVADGLFRSAIKTIAMGIRTATLSRIHDIQGAGSASPVDGTVVTTEGVVTGRRSNGFFIQDLEANYDADASTSEGVFVFTSSTPPAVAAIGSFLTLVGTVSEFKPNADAYQPPQTELVNSFGVAESAGNPLPAAVELTGSLLDANGSVEQLEPLEGMRVSMASAKVVAPTGGSRNETNATSTSNGVFYVVLPEVDRPFREPGIEVFEPIPSGAPATIPRFDANPQRVRVDSDALGAPALNVMPGQLLSNLVGPLDYGFRSYTIDLDPASPATVTGALLAPAPVRTATAAEFTVATANLERFFDTVDDPDTSDAVLTATAFANRLNKVSQQVRHVMGAPDIIGVEEVENLSTLQAIATKVNTDAVAAGDPDPGYVAYLEEGNDIGGIDSGFLVKSSHVGVVDVVQEGKEAIYINPLNGQPELLNDRPPLVMRAIVHHTAGDAGLPVTVIVNHLRSLSSINSATDGARVRAKRRAQAEYLANLIQTKQAADPGERIVSVGDYNAFQFSDGYVDSIGTIKGMPTPAELVTLASDDLVNPDLVDLVDTAPAGERYSFVFDGNAQELDHVLITQNLVGLSNGLSYGRSNADFPEVLRNDPGTPTRLSDHDPLVAYFAFPSLSIDDVTVRESNSAVVTALFTVSLSAPTPNRVTIDFSTADGTATSSDYAPAAGTLIFEPGTTTQTIAVDVLANGIPEPTETFAVNLSSPVNAIVADSQGIGTIIDSHDRPLAIRTFAPARRGVGGTVVIVGTGFDAVTTVTFNGMPASFRILSSTVLQAIVPAGATAGPITVSSSTETATSAASFIVTP